MLSRLLEAHEVIIAEARKGAEKAEQAGDQGTNDILVSDVLRTNELQTWFIARAPGRHAPGEGVAVAGPPPGVGGARRARRASGAIRAGRPGRRAR
jgi:hypothetical protein